MDSSAYLTRHGWRGKGHALRSGAIQKPLLVSKKSNVLGIGRKRIDAHADQWWAKAFDIGLKNLDVESTSDSIKAGNQKTNTDPLKLLRNEKSKWAGLYSGFVKGQGLEGTCDFDHVKLHRPTTEKEAIRSPREDADFTEALMRSSQECTYRLSPDSNALYDFKQAGQEDTSNASTFSGFAAEIANANREKVKRTLDDRRDLNYLEPRCDTSKKEKKRKGEKTRSTRQNTSSGEVGRYSHGKSLSAQGVDGAQAYPKQLSHTEVTKQRDHKLAQSPLNASGELWSPESTGGASSKEAKRLRKESRRLRKSQLLSSKE